MVKEEAIGGEGGFFAGDTAHGGDGVDDRFVFVFADEDERAAINFKHFANGTDHDEGKLFHIQGFRDSLGIVTDGDAGFEIFGGEEALDEAFDEAGNGAGGGEGEDEENVGIEAADSAGELFEEEEEGDGGQGGESGVETHGGDAAGAGANIEHAVGGDGVGEAEDASEAEAVADPNGPFGGDEEDGFAGNDKGEGG